MSPKNKRWRCFLVMSAHPGFGFYDGSLANRFVSMCCPLSDNRPHASKGGPRHDFVWKLSRPFGVVFFFL